jgi:hypothetical protein
MLASDAWHPDWVFVAKEIGVEPGRPSSSAGSVEILLSSSSSELTEASIAHIPADICPASHELCQECKALQDRLTAIGLTRSVSEAPSALTVRSRLDRKSPEDYKCTVTCNDVRV